MVEIQDGRNFKMADIFQDYTKMYPPYVWIPPVCLVGSLYVWTPPYAWMPLYVRVPPMFGCPLYAWTSPICLDAPHTFG